MCVAAVGVVSGPPGFLSLEMRVWVEYGVRSYFLFGLFAFVR